MLSMLICLVVKSMLISLVKRMLMSFVKIMLISLVLKNVVVSLVVNSRPMLIS